MKICSNCIKSDDLKRYINENGNISDCYICKKIYQSIDILDNDFQNRFKAVFRYYYSETLYNSHWGGHCHWIDLLMTENELFNFVIPMKYEDTYLDKFVDSLDLIKAHVSDYDNEVSLYYGGGRLDAYMYSIQNTISEEFMDIERECNIINPHFLINKTEKLISKIESDITSRINQTEFFRARVGYKEHYRCMEPDFENIYNDVFIPYTMGDISAPPLNIAAEGRVNRKNSSFLYLASNEVTAVKEVKASIGQYVSLGKFKIKDGLDLKIADFSSHKFYDYCFSDNAIEKYILIRSIADAYSIPLPNKDYRITQLIADVLIKKGFNGIMFKSSYGEGNNLVIFNSIVAENIDGYKAVIKVEEVKVKYSSVEINIDEELRYISMLTDDEIGPDLIDNTEIDILRNCSSNYKMNQVNIVNDYVQNKIALKQFETDANKEPGYRYFHSKMVGNIMLKIIEDLAESDVSPAIQKELTHSKDLILIAALIHDFYQDNNHHGKHAKKHLAKKLNSLMKEYLGDHKDEWDDYPKLEIEIIEDMVEEHGDDIQVDNDNYYVMLIQDADKISKYAYNLFDKFKNQYFDISFDEVAKYLKPEDNVKIKHQNLNFKCSRKLMEI